MLELVWSLLLLGEGCDVLAVFVDAAEGIVDGAVFIPRGPEPFFLTVLVLALPLLLIVGAPEGPRQRVTTPRHRNGEWVSWVHLLCLGATQ
jgi:hypothetical protein